MHVASLELCKELYGLSGWGQNLKEDSLNIWGVADDKRSAVITQMKPSGSIGIPTELIPAYDLGYLLRKLPMQIEQPTTTYFFQLTEGVEAKWHIDYRDENDGQYTAVDADTPEDAACRLTIELFKEGILKPQEK